MAPSFSGVWKLQTKYQYSSEFPLDPILSSSRILVSGGYNNSVAAINVIEFFLSEVSSNATDFGDLSVTRGSTNNLGNDTRAVTVGGYSGSADVNVMDYVTYSTTGNAQDFGDLTTTLSSGPASISNNVRGIIAGGQRAGSASNTTDFITIASTGDATDFGDLTAAKGDLNNGVVASTTRGIAAGGGSQTNVIEYFTIASAGNGTDFGDLTVGRDQSPGGAASSTRGVFAGGRSDSNNVNYNNEIDYITIASTGNATDFGDLTVGKRFPAGSSTSTKGFFSGGSTSGSARTDQVEFITIASTGNGTDFIDLTASKFTHGSSSAGHPAAQIEADFPPAALGLFAGGDGTANDPILRNIDFINIASTGNSSLFGEIRFGQRYAHGGGASTTRGIFAGGANHANSYSGYQTIEYISLQSKGATQDFGDMTDNRFSATTLSNGTRALIAQGTTGNVYSSVNSIDKITIASLGNATDFGDATDVRQDPNSVASTTRGIIAGGISGTGGLSAKNTIDYVTIASDGNGTDFGDLTVARYGLGNGGNSTRGLFAGGNGDGTVNTIDYITIASAGNATDFGDLNVTREYMSGASSSTRVVFGNGSDTNKGMDFVTIASTGNASDFGDLIGDYGAGQALSNSHGGLS